MTTTSQSVPWLVALSQFMVKLMDWVAPVFGRPRVRTIDTEHLAERLAQPEPDCVLVDVRSQAEVQVSMIPGAITREEFQRRRDELNETLVIAYCTVGGRSLLFAQECARDGFDVRNYQGSILEWCMSGRPLVDPHAQPTRRVHTHNRLFRSPPGYERVA